MGLPGFWDSPSSSAPILRQRRSLERLQETLKRLRSDAEEVEVWKELVAEGENDEQLGTFLERLDSELPKLDLQLKLSGPDDDKNAILNLHPGAGGTESQDWAEMLLRM
ncbi:MAG: PCRF domain-containing protein, partial [Acidobacteria bacterium]|nr:PCRF domain-containing protein [Acidobacteriota bacterium]